MTRLLNAGVLIVLIAMTSSVALAGRGDRGGRYHSPQQRIVPSDDTRFRIDISFGQSSPRYEERVTRVWVEPEYRTVCERVWIEPVVRDVCETVWVPDRWEVRNVVYYECGRRIVRCQRVLVAPGHYESRTRRVVVCEGRWDYVERQELVREGYWDCRTERVVVDDCRPVSGFGMIARFTR